MTKIKTKRKRKLPPNWKTRLTVVKSKKNHYWGDDVIKFNLVFDKKPKGYSKQQGHLVLEQKTPYLVRSGWVSRQFHHRSMGYTLYTHALKKLGKLSTEYNEASKQAQKLWRRLMNEFEHHIGDDGQLTVYNRRIRVRKRK